MAQTAAKPQANSLNQLTDQVMAFDLLISAKMGVLLLSRALTEASTPDVRIMLKKFLDQAADHTAQIGAYIADKGWVKPDDMKDQLTADAKKAQETLDMLK
jgi:similar to spore coat protein